MTVTVLLDIHVATASLASAPSMLREILAGTRAFDGCLSVEVLVDNDDPGHLVLLERWASLEHDAAYRAWRAGAGATELGSILAGPPQLSKFQTADDI